MEINKFYFTCFIPEHIYDALKIGRKFMKFFFMFGTVLLFKIAITK